MLQDTTLGGLELVRQRQEELRQLAERPRAGRTRARTPRPLRLRPDNQPSIIVTPRPAQLRRQWGPVAGS